MNSVNLIGRIARDPVISYTQTQMAVCRFSLALDRGKDKDGNDRGADFPSCVAFGKTAEFIDKWLKKGQLVGIVGHLQTGSYEKDGQKIYTTDVVVDRTTMVDWGKKDDGKPAEAPAEKPAQADMYTDLIPDEDIPF